jgi:NAD(P)-dependent dehydrogenase (short-subunit alcohol dehydrogenase family)
MMGTENEARTGDGRSGHRGGFGHRSGASRVQTNALAPGTVDTPMVRAAAANGDRPSGASPIGGIARPADVMFLLSDAARYVSEPTIAVGGGSQAALISAGAA